MSRKAKTKVSPVYPDVARRMSIAGTVRLAVVVSPNGTVKSSKPVGGHPLLVDAAMDAMKRWKFETGPTESSGIVEFKFHPRGLTSRKIESGFVLRGVQKRGSRERRNSMTIGKKLYMSFGAVLAWSWCCLP